MEHMQALIDGMSAQWMRERAASQMTLGKLIERLEAMPPETPIVGLGDCDSYRGYYSDLAFEPTGNSETTATALLDKCKGAMGQVFHGYKGGDYVMGALTPLWVAHYGCCGQKLMGIAEDGTPITAADES
jgi:hypothetical protein